MAHLNRRLPEEIALGPVRRADWGVEVVQVDSGAEVRNARWSSPLREFEVSFPPTLRNGSVYLDVVDLFEASMGGLHTFDFVDWTDETGSTLIRVRFASALEIEGMATHLDRVTTFTLKEVRE
jgi:uncharacterized protein (TIGR02217 family)